ncbi:luciferase family protein [Agromyces larvae]|uniref:DUF5519 family protein n=1 Tax=Agromyces larvae TaxID=2929802 RepID=A0ABY4C3R8_9MICO|nr:luciferase family protein [Agromyces larvae]UOE46122.1 DUF5519 family protein [Agromyces larvae]
MHRLSPMPMRAGAAPTVSDEGPQRQLDQQSPPEIWGRLVHDALALPGVVEGHSAVSPVGSRAFLLADLVEAPSPERSLAPPEDRLEPAHVHGVGDTSLHLVLPPRRGTEIVAAGWGIPHAYGDYGTEWFVYGPRNERELAFVLELIREALDFARVGTSG